MERVLGVGSRIPRAFQTVHVRVGQPLDLSEVLDRPLPEDRRAEIDFYREIANRVVEAIRELAPPS
jgi:1-acyl-sn-glycerol-3-phosphate acyltransferase